MKETINERKIAAAERNDASWNPNTAHESRERPWKRNKPPPNFFLPAFVEWACDSRLACVMEISFVLFLFFSVCFR